MTDETQLAFSGFEDNPPPTPVDDIQRDVNPSEPLPRLPCSEHGLDVDAAPVTGLCPVCVGERFAAAGWATRLLSADRLRDEYGLEPRPNPWPLPEPDDDESEEAARPVLLRMPRWYADACDAVSRAVWRGQVTDAEATALLDVLHSVALGEALRASSANAA